MRILAVAAASAMAVTAHAVEPEWYFGIGAGSANLDRRFLVTLNEGQITSFQYSDSHGRDAAFTARYGWRFHRHGALEVSYFELGKYAFDFGALSGGGVAHGTQRARSGAVSAVGIVPLERGELYGRLGYAKVHLESESTDAGASFSSKERVYGAVGGVGARWNFSRAFGVFAEYQRWDKPDIDAWFAGVDIRF